MERRIQEDIATKVAPYRYTALLAVGLVGLQCLDGFLTSLGVQRYGIESEGNPLLRELMLHIGAVPALALVKIFAIFCVVFMALLVRKVPWVPYALIATSGIYVVFAVVPWSYYLFLLPWLETAMITP